MKKVSKVFCGTGEVSGIMFTQIKRHGLDCIYERSDGYYEVITLVEQKEKTTVMGGKEIHYEAKEVYCKGESWGTKAHGQCVGSKQKAIELFNERIVE